MDQQEVMRETSTMRLGQRLRRARLARNMTQGEVARNQFSVSYVSAVERGQIRPSLGALEKLAERLQVPITDLLGDVDLDARMLPATGESREASPMRFREEIEDRLIEAQVLMGQRKADDALTILLRLTAQQLSQREAAQVHWRLAYCYVELGRGEEARRESIEAMSNAERLGDRELVERIRNELGNAYTLLHSHQAALDAYMACLSAIEEGAVKDISFKMAVLQNIGNQYLSKGIYDEAITYQRRAAELAADVVNPEQMGVIYWALSRSYSGKGDHSQAKLYALRAIAMYEQAGNRRLVAQVYNRLGRAYAQSGQMSDALAQLQTAYELAQAQQDRRGISEAQRSLADVYLRQNKVDDAARAAEDALSHAEATHDVVQRAESLMVLAEVRERQQRFDEAEQNFNTAIELLRQTDASEWLREGYEKFSEYLERRGESKRAYEMLKLAYRTTGITSATIPF
jgi:tetratricopeptide (TPR) repeat protein